MTAGAHAITIGFINHVDCLIDIHAGGTFPWVDYCYVLNDEGLSLATPPVSRDIERVFFPDVAPGVQASDSSPRTL